LFVCYFITINSQSFPVGRNGEIIYDYYPQPLGGSGGAYNPGLPWELAGSGGGGTGGQIIDLSAMGGQPGGNTGQGGAGPADIWNIIEQLGPSNFDLLNNQGESSRRTKVGKSSFWS
jgi:hypothetical protein